MVTMAMLWQPQHLEACICREYLLLIALCCDQPATRLTLYFLERMAKDTSVSCHSRSLKTLSRLSLLASRVLRYGLSLCTTTGAALKKLTRLGGQRRQGVNSRVLHDATADLAQYSQCAIVHC